MREKQKFRIQALHVRAKTISNAGTMNTRHRRGGCGCVYVPNKSIAMCRLLSETTRENNQIIRMVSQMTFETCRGMGRGL